MRRRVWHPHTRIDIRLLSPCFKTGRPRPLRQHPRRGAVLGPGGPHRAAGCNAPRGEPHSRGPSPAARTDAGRGAAGHPGASPGGSAAPQSGRGRFPLSNFTCCLTLFPKCFSSFDHSTCALSVSSRYLALEEIYLPLRAAFPNNSTRRKSPTRGGRTAADGTLTLSDAPFQGTWAGAPPGASSANYNSGPGRARFQIWEIACITLLANWGPRLQIILSQRL